MEQFETQVTAIVSRYVGAYLEQYAANPSINWKSKDTAIFLLTSIASKGSTLQQGVTSTNALVDVVKFFSDHVLADLQAATGSVHPIIQADAIKFLYTFRNQVCAALVSITFVRAQPDEYIPLLNGHSSQKINSYPSFLYSYLICKIHLSSFIPMLPSPSSAFFSLNKTQHSCKAIKSPPMAIFADAFPYCR